MKKGPLGFTIGTVLTVIICFIIAVLFWLFVKYNEFSGAEMFINVVGNLPHIAL